MAFADANLADEETQTGQDGSSRAASEAASVPAPSSFGRPAKTSKRSRSITPEGGLKQQHYAQHQYSSATGHGTEKLEPEHAPWQGFAQSGGKGEEAEDEQKESWMHHSNVHEPAAYAKHEPVHGKADMGFQSWQQSVKSEDGMEHRGGALEHQLSRGLSSSQSLPVSNTESGKPKKTGLKIKLKLKAS